MNILKLPQWIAHRGASRYAPENTLTALRAAHDLGASWVECDVRLTRDSEAVIFHDATLKRCTNGHGRISSTTYQTLAQLDAGSWFNPQFIGEKIPTLHQWLQLAAQLKLGLNLELKGSIRDATRLVKELLHSLAMHWHSRLPMPLISSSDIACLKAMKKFAPELPRALISSHVTQKAQIAANKLQCISFHTDYHYLRPLAINALKQQGFQVLIYTVNDTKIAKQWLDAGVDGVFTDNPHLLTS